MVGKRLREKAASRYLSRLLRMEQKEEEEEEEEACILQHPQLEEEEEGEETKGEEEQLQHPGPQDNARGDKGPHSKKVHFPFFRERYQSMEEQTDGEKPKKDYQKELKKYGKNARKVITKGIITAYSSPFTESDTLPPFIL
ncbi:uncharacterized protein C1orf115-like [Dromiciops gliroides]|uniref:uncharacterized protein C1orf115-like n=1 Tax=Dromiciops gliroides TaxID=33562 RepID=UPI001CC7AE7E|nr:uncharacterized protein C1orf115-like [Dromiciops gliroides]